MSAPPGTQTYKEENQKSTLHHHSVIEKIILFERLPTEVQLPKQHSMRAIHVLAVCQYHIHHLPVHHYCISKILTLLLIYNINFKVHPVYPWILAKSLFWLPALSPDHPNWLSVLFLSVFWRGCLDSLPFCFKPQLPPFFLPSSFHHLAFLPLWSERDIQWTHAL